MESLFNINKVSDTIVLDTFYNKLTCNTFYELLPNGQQFLSIAQNINFNSNDYKTSVDITNKSISTGIADLYKSINNNPLLLNYDNSSSFNSGCYQNKNNLSKQLNNTIYFAPILIQKNIPDYFVVKKNNKIVYFYKFENDFKNKIKAIVDLCNIPPIQKDDFQTDGINFIYRLCGIDLLSGTLNNSAITETIKNFNQKYIDQRPYYHHFIDNKILCNTIFNFLFHFNIPDNENVDDYIGHYYYDITYSDAIINKDKFEYDFNLAKNVLDYDLKNMNINNEKFYLIELTKPINLINHPKISFYLKGDSNLYSINPTNIDNCKNFSILEDKINLHDLFGFINPIDCSDIFVYDNDVYPNLKLTFEQNINLFKYGEYISVKSSLLHDNKLEKMEWRVYINNENYDTNCDNQIYYNNGFKLNFSSKQIINNFGYIQVMVENNLILQEDSQIEFEIIGLTKGYCFGTIRNIINQTDRTYFDLYADEDIIKKISNQEIYFTYLQSPYYYTLITPENNAISTVCNTFVKAFNAFSNIICPIKAIQCSNDPNSIIFISKFKNEANYNLYCNIFTYKENLKSIIINNDIKLNSVLLDNNSKLQKTQIEFGGQSNNKQYSLLFNNNSLNQQLNDEVYILNKNNSFSKIKKWKINNQNKLKFFNFIVEDHDLKNYSLMMVNYNKKNLPYIKDNAITIYNRIMPKIIQLQEV